MNITGKVKIEIDDKELASVLRQKILSLVGKNFDDAGCDWYTDDNGITYIANNIEWVASNDPFIASLVDSANYLAYGEHLKIH